MLDAPSTAKTLDELTVGIPGAGRRTLLAALPTNLRLPASLRLCVLDASRMDSPAQIALLDTLAKEQDHRILFVLNKADLIGGPRTTVTRTLALLRERGFARPELYLTCAEAARLFRLPTEALPLTDAERKALGDYYFRYGPGENNLSAFAVTDAKAYRLGSREVTSEQLCIAVGNTGVTALETRLRSLALPKEPAAPPEAATVGGDAHIGPPPDDTTAPEKPPLLAGEGDRRPAAVEGSVPTTDTPVGADAHIGPPPDDTTAPEKPPLLAGEGDRRPAAVEGSVPTTDTQAAPPAEAAQTVDVPAPEAAPPEDLLLEDMEAALNRLLEEPEGTPQHESGAFLSTLHEQAVGADCAKLLALAMEVQAEKLPAEDKEQVLNALHEAYKSRERTELQSLTLEADSLELPALMELRDRINAGPYTVQTRTPYAELLTHRIDELQSAALNELCAGVEEADGLTLAKLRAAVDAMDCAEVLKTESYRRMDERQDQLDRETLDRVTAGAENMTEPELRALAVTLEANNWSPKYVTAYRQRVEILREAAVVRELRRELADLNDMERREVLELREQIQEKALPPRFTAAPLTQIDERLYRMDMLRLLALNNDFDQLGFEDLDNLRASVSRLEVCEQAKKTYLHRLLEREEALILEQTEARAQLTRQLIGQCKLRMGDFSIASASTEFADQVQAFWGGSGLEQPRDLPVFLLDNASDYAFTGKRFYYKVGRDLAFLPLEEIERFQIMRQRLALNLQIVRKDNSYLLTEARIGRGNAERTLDFLNECLRRWFEPGMDGARPVNPIRTRRFELSEFTQPTQTRLPDAETALNIFRSSYTGAKLREGNLIRAGEEGWEQRLRRLLLNFELPENTPVVWFCSASLLGSVKEGVAFGPKAIYYKQNKQPTRILHLGEIWQITRSGSKQVTVTTIHNQSCKLDISGDMAPLLADYVRTIQLGAYLRSTGEAE